MTTENVNELSLEDRVVHINIVAKVVKGGRNFSFAALVIVGDHGGNVGMGYGKAREVPMAVEKATKDAKKNMHVIPLVDGTTPHKIQGKFGATKITLVPASPGTGVIAPTFSLAASRNSSRSAEGQAL